MTDQSEEPKEHTKEELIEMLDNMIRSFENLPQSAMLTPITYYDHVSLMMLLSTILKTKDENENKRNSKSNRVSKKPNKSTNCKSFI